MKKKRMISALVILFSFSALLLVGCRASSSNASGNEPKAFIHIDSAEIQKNSDGLPKKLVVNYTITGEYSNDGIEGYSPEELEKPIIFNVKSDKTDAVIKAETDFGETIGGVFLSPDRYGTKGFSYTATVKLDELFSSDLGDEEPKTGFIIGFEYYGEIAASNSVKLEYP